MEGSAVNQRMRLMQATYDEQGFSLLPQQESKGWLSWLRGNEKTSLRELMKEQPALAWALGDLEVLADKLHESIDRGEAELRISHRLAAHASPAAAEILGLPPLVDLTLHCDLRGNPEDPDFRIICTWQRRGRDVMPRRVGAVLELAEGAQRLPGPIYEALQILDDIKQSPPSSADERWTALAHFRQALLPLMETDHTQAAIGKLDLVAALRDLRISLVDRFSLAVNEQGSDFDIVPFSSRNEEVGEQGGHGEVSEEKSALYGGDLAVYQSRTRERGARHVMRLGRSHCVVTDADMLPAFQTAARFLKAPPEEKRQFIANPRPYVSQAIEEHLRQKGKLEGLTPEGVEEIVERLSDRAFLETREYAERVKGVGYFERVSLPPGSVAESTWVPEDIRSLTDYLRDMNSRSLSLLLERLREAREEGRDAVQVDGLTWPANDLMIQLVEQRLAELQAEQDEFNAAAKAEAASEGKDKPQPLVLLTHENVHDLIWRASWKARSDQDLPIREQDLGLLSELRPHQQDALEWQAKAWMSGAPGILNADEQGLGKTLETLAFLRWLAVTGKPAATQSARKGACVLVVAPVSLLRNWEQEASYHVASKARARIVRLYGSHLRTFRQADAPKGHELKWGRPLLDLSSLKTEIDGGADIWLIASYETVVNYQHSLGSIIFDVAIFDEIQALKNPSTLRHAAARAINADFRIGLTGTPIENTVAELWAIMDVLAPGAMGLSLSEFLQSYGTSLDEERLAELKRRLFESIGGQPPLALRRLKSEVARDLPRKSWRLYPAFMPVEQQQVYDKGFSALAEIRRKGQHLKFLQHIRSASLHPCLVQEKACVEDLHAGSARIQLLAEILDEIQAKDERALVFLESRQLQYQLAEWLATRYELGYVGIINGDTPIDKRRRLVERFQSHLENDRGFDVLILSPRAAGAGLTLTAACHVIPLSRWWNPAVEDQCTDRTHRIGQRHDVTVHIPMAIHPKHWERSFDFSLQELLMAKRRLSRQVLWPMGDTQDDVRDLFDRITLSAENIVEGYKQDMQSLLLDLQCSLNKHGINESYVRSNFWECQS